MRSSGIRRWALGIGVFALQLSAFSFCFSPLPCAAVPPRSGRAIILLDGEWKFHTDSGDNGVAQGWDHSVPANAMVISTPSLWKQQGASDYTGAAWYWREFDIPQKWKGQTVRIRFEAAAEQAQVWLNGHRLGEHNGGVTPFDLYATPALQVGQRNLLAVRLEGSAASGAGLWQHVLLLSHDEAYIADCFPQANSAGEIDAHISFVNTSKNEGDATLDVRLVAADAPNRELHLTNQNLHVTPGKNETDVILALSGKSLRLWSPASPFLYRLQSSFRQDQDILDNQETEFGFHQFGFQDGAITLNGVPIKPVAQSPPFFLYPYVISTPAEETRARGLLQGLKAQGITVITLVAPPPALLQLADEVGLLVVERGRVGERTQERTDEVRELILRDRAHPCLLAWDPGDVDEAAARQLHRLAPSSLLLFGPTASPHLLAPDRETVAEAPAGLR